MLQIGNQVTEGKCFSFKGENQNKKENFFLQGEFLLLNLVAVVHLMINPEHTVNKKKLSSPFYNSEIF